MKLKKLVEPLGEYRLVGDGDTAITGLEYDSRRIKPGMLFAAITGYRLDGKEFIPQAVKNGAAAILSDTEIKADIPNIISTVYQEGAG